MKFPNWFANRVFIPLVMVFGLSLVIAVFVFPVVKAGDDGRFDTGTLASGYAVVLVAIVAAAGLNVWSRRETWPWTRLRTIEGSPDGARLIYFFALCFAARIVGTVIFSQEPFGDTASHEAAAWHVSQGDGYLRKYNGITAPDAHWPPGYVYVASGIYWLFGRSYIYLSVFNGVLDSLTCMLVYLLARRIFDAPAACVAALLYAMNPVLIVKTQLINYAPLFGLLTAAIALLATKRGVIVGILYGVTSLVKPIFLVGPALSVVHDILLGRSPKDVLRRLVVISCLMFVTIAPWTIRNYVVFDRFLPVSANGGWVLWWGNNPDATGRMMNWTPEQREARGAALIDIDRELGNEAVAWILDNPSSFLALIPRKQAYMWGTEAASLPRLKHLSGPVLWATRSLTQLFYVFLVLLAAYTLIRRTRDLLGSPEAVMICLVLLLAWGIHSVYIGWSFYHHGVLPLITVIAVGAIGGHGCPAGSSRASTS